MDLIRFEHTEYLYGLLLVPIWISIYFAMVKDRKKAIKLLGDAPLIERLSPETDKRKHKRKFILLLIAFILLIIAFANPQIGSKIDKAERKGIDLMIALDISNSMLAEDIKPNRLSRAKQALSKLIEKLENDRIGIVIFAGGAYTQLPITNDYAAAKMFVDAIETDMINEQGTAIGKAIKTASEAFNLKDKEKNKAIIVISDGENHEDDAVEQAKIANEEGIMVNTIGMGLPDGTPIPIYSNGGVVGFKKDREGNTVVTKINTEMLQQIAEAGGGEFVGANNTNSGIQQIFENLKKLEQKKYDTKVYSDYEDRFQYFTGIAVLLMIIDLLIKPRRNKFFSKVNLFGEKKV